MSDGSHQLPPGLRGRHREPEIVLYCPKTERSLTAGTGSFHVLDDHETLFTYLTNIVRDS
jgi:hypothetical protein